MSATVFLLAAGFGTRLRPLTNHRPKPLLPLLGRPMVDFAVGHLYNHGHREFVVNAHHLWEKVQEWAHNPPFDVNIAVQIELPNILGTGGGLKVAEEDLAETFLIWNGDIFSDIDPEVLLNGCDGHTACMALNHNDDLGKTTRLMFDETGNVVRIGTLCQTEDAEDLPTTKDGWHFSGIHAIKRDGLQDVPDGFQCIVRSGYMKWVPEREVSAMLHNGFWVDTGTPIEYWRANMAALRGEFPLPFDGWSETNSMCREKGSWVHQSATIEGNIQDSIVGAGATVPAEATLTECIVWDGVDVPEGTYTKCIFYDGGVLDLNSLAS